MARYRFRLNSGQHIQADRTQKPAIVTDPVTGKTTEVYPKRTFKHGEIIESDANLAARFGSEQYTLLSGDGSDYHDSYAAAPSVAPGGQVSSGFQTTSGEGKTGAMTPEQIEGMAKDAATQPKSTEPLRPNPPFPVHQPGQVHLSRPAQKPK